MDTNALLALAHQFLPADLWQKGLQVYGALTLASQCVPKLLSWGVPAAGNAADWVARTALASPLRPLILWKADSIAAFLDSLTSALAKIADTFKGRLEADIKAAEPVVPPASEAKAPDAKAS